MTLPAVLIDLPYFMTDFRVDNPRGKHTHGTVFLCGFGAKLTDGRILVGMNNMLWRVEPDKYSPYRHITCSRMHVRIIESYMQVYRFSDTDYAGPRCSLLYDLICERTGRITRHTIHRGVLINVHHLVIRLQRWMRRVVLGRSRALALAMSLHARLGVGSSLSMLGEDVLSLLIRCG